MPSSAMSRSSWHQHLSLIEIHRHLGVTALFDTLFTYENYPVEPPPPARSAVRICL